MVVVLKAIVEHCAPLALGLPFEFPCLEVSQTDVFHGSSPGSSPWGRSEQHGLARWIVHPMVVGHRRNSTNPSKKSPLTHGNASRQGPMSVQALMMMLG